jgi:hypothetical protein
MNVDSYASAAPSSNASFDEPGARLLPLQNSVRRLRSGKDFGRRRKQAISGDEYRRVYLFLFNLLQLVGFIYLLVVLSIRYAKDGSSKFLFCLLLRFNHPKSPNLDLNQTQQNQLKVRTERSDS